jgi:glycosyltransferase involved in cell wall biosynthesis
MPAHHNGKSITGWLASKEYRCLPLTQQSSLRNQNQKTQRKPLPGGRHRYNGGVRIRLAFDARKLTDYGIGTYVSNLVQGLACRPELRLTLLVRAGHEQRARALAPGARVVTANVKGYTVSELLRLPWIVQREPVNLVHFPHYVMPPFMTIPAIVTVHDVIQLFYLPQRRHAALWYLRAMMRAALRRGRRVITVSRASRSDLVNLFRGDPKRLEVIPNGVDRRFAERPDDQVIEQLKKRYKLRPPLIAVVGNDKPHKNYDVVVRAFALARRRHQIPGQLVFIGGPDADSRLARRAASLGLQGRMLFLGRIPESDLHGLYHLSAMLLHIALFEGFGLPVLEAMCAGLPVITSNLGAMREVGEGSARLVNPLDVEEIASTIEEVLVDDSLRRRMIEAGRRRAAKMTWEQTVEGTVAVYRKVLEEVQA